MSFKRASFLFVLQGLLYLSAAQWASAAPQILGLLPTKVPQALYCDGPVCTADLASFCLQPGRGEPWPGQLYEAKDSEALRLVARTPDGREVSVKAGPHVKFVANVAMAAVQVRIDRSLLNALGVSGLALQVGPDVSLLPVAVPGDPDPLTAAEIADATGWARSVGADFFEDGSAVGVTARLTAALMSQTPRLKRLSAARRGTLWTDAIGSELIGASSPEGLAGARRHFEACRAAVASGTHYSMRSCLEVRHGDLVRKHNRLLRKALKTGW